MEVAHTRIDFLSKISKISKPCSLRSRAVLSTPLTYSCHPVNAMFRAVSVLRPQQPL